MGGTVSTLSNARSNSYCPKDGACGSSNEVLKSNLVEQQRAAENSSSRKPWQKLAWHSTCFLLAWRRPAMMGPAWAPARQPVLHLYTVPMASLPATPAAWSLCRCTTPWAGRPAATFC
uniref:Uncharacterized protein n=1 Tax=Macrostomum lignano TaxID=282301 RepID=A0A1I8HQ87_9PLAT